MPIKPTFPGVYIEEIPSGVRTITGVSTSIALFIGRTRRGALDTPTLCLNFSDFERAFSADSTFGDMARAVRLFFANGGTQCYVMRIATGATAATVTLQSETGAAVLSLTAKEAGLIGETIRVAVTYNGLQPEATFNMELFRWETNAQGQLVKVNQEVFTNLTMDPLSSRFAPAILSQNSNLVNAASVVAPAIPPPPNPGFSQSGRPVSFDNAAPVNFLNAWADRFGNKAGVTTNVFRISVDGTPFTDVNLSNIDVGATAGATLALVQSNLATAVANRINSFLPLGKTVQVRFATGPTPPAPDNTTTLLRIESVTGDVFIQPSVTGDLAIPLMLGTAQGGLEVSGYATVRPAPTGITFKALTALVDFAGLAQNSFNTITIDGVAIPLSIQTAGPTAPMYKDGNPATAPNGGNDGVRQKLALIATAVNNAAAGNPAFKYKAEVWGLRLAILPANGGDNSIGTISTGGLSNVNIGTATNFTRNVRYYSVGVSGVAGTQTPGPLASDGGPPTLSSYANAYLVVDKEVDIFNLLILPKDAAHSAATTASLWGPASIFCQQRRAFLLMDAPESWGTVQQATSLATGVNSLRTGLVKDHSAIFFPQLVVNEDGREVKVGPAGAMAGLMARIDATRGVWKAAAGTEADIRGIVGLDKKFSDAENGVLNPNAINTIRVFPNGIVSWGARTMEGADDFGSEYKYIPVRRVALFIEESLYRGTKFAVFEPNDEPLWSQIRLNLGAFMHTLFRQGAFQGRTPKEAYLVKCDSETTTQNDINLGIVNILVGFAPLKPAEFVIIKIQQLAGQIQV